MKIAIETHCASADTTNEEMKLASSMSAITTAKADPTMRKRQTIRAL